MTAPTTPYTTEILSHSNDSNDRIYSRDRGLRERGKGRKERRQKEGGKEKEKDIEEREEKGTPMYILALIQDSFLNQSHPGVLQESKHRFSKSFASQQVPDRRTSLGFPDIIAEAFSLEGPTSFSVLTPVSIPGDVSHIFPQNITLKRCSSSALRHH